jgi:hypothetical protein
MSLRQRKKVPGEAGHRIDGKSKYRLIEGFLSIGRGLTNLFINESGEKPLAVKEFEEDWRRQYPTSKEAVR